MTLAVIKDEKCQSDLKIILAVLCQSGCGKFLGRVSKNRSIWAHSYRGRSYVVVYSTATKTVAKHCRVKSLRRIGLRTALRLLWGSP
jgi:hypothetical protein